MDLHQAMAQILPTLEVADYTKQGRKLCHWPWSWHVTQGIAQCYLCLDLKVLVAPLYFYAFRLKNKKFNSNEKNATVGTFTSIVQVIQEYWKA